MKEIDQLLKDYDSDEFNDPPGWLLSVIVAVVGIAVVLVPYCGWLQ